MPDPLPLHRVLAERAPSALLGFRGTEAIAYANLQQRVAAWRQRLDLAPGSPLAIYHEDALELLAALLAAWSQRLAVLLPGDALPATAQGLLRSGYGLAGSFGAATTHPSPPAHEPSPGPQPPTSWADGLDGVLLLQTSGSTGQPLRVSRRLSQVQAEIDALERCFGDRLGNARVAATVSHQHIYGLLFRLLWPFCAGRPFEARPHAYLESVGSQVDDAEGEACGLILVASPAHLRRLPSTMDWSGRRRRLRAVFSSGGALPAEAAAALAAASGQYPLEIYGSTETGAIGWRQQRSADAPYAPLPGVELREDGASAVRLRSPFSTAGEWSLLADRTTLDAAGNLHLLGRADRIVKIEEKRISLDAVEQAALAGPWLEAARVLPLKGSRDQLGLCGVPTARGREVLLTQGRRALAGVLRREMAGAVEAVALPRRFRFVAELPGNAQGKIAAAAVQALFAEVETAPYRPFHRWIERSADRARAELLIGPDLHAFQGHFPGQPIVPGVSQLDWSVDLARSIFPISPALQRMENLKFHATIEPATCVQLELAWDAGEAVLDFRLYSANAVHASGRLRFLAEGG